MKALILAAGYGNRLWPVTLTTHKALLYVGDKPVLWYSITNLLAVGVDEFVVVVGYKAHQVIQFISAAFPELKVTYVYNSEYRTRNSIYSYYLAREHILGSSYIRLAGDLIYTKNIISTLLKKKTGIYSAVEERKKETNEEFSAAIDATRKVIVEYGKHIPAERSFGEAQGIDLITKEKSQLVVDSLKEIIAHEQYKEFPEYAYQNLINKKAIEVGYSLLSKDDFWCEVDTIDDLIYANNSLKLFAK